MSPHAGDLPSAEQGFFMAVRRNALPPEMVRAEDDHVVVTVTAKQAEAIATAIASSAATRHDEFLADVAHAVAVKARRHDDPRLSRGAFLRGRWSASKADTAVSRSGLAVTEDAHVVGLAEALPEAPGVESAPVQPTLEPRRLQDIDPSQLAGHQRRAAEALAGSNAAELAAARATQAAAVVQLRADAAALRAGQAHHQLTDDRVEAMELAEEKALTTAAVARAVAAAAVQAAATASAAVAEFESEVASVAAVLAAMPAASAPAAAGAPAPVSPSAARAVAHVEAEHATESVRIS